MLVQKGGKSKNWGGECRDVTPTKLQSQNIFKESLGGRVGGGGGWIRVGGGGQGRCEQRSEVFVKIKKMCVWGGGGGVSSGGGGGGRVGGQDGC